MEDYLEHNSDPSPKIAARIEQRMASIGQDIFRAIFESDRDMMRLWDNICDDLSSTRMEISTGVTEANVIPWELLRDPRTDAPLPLTAAEFVRVQSQTARMPKLPQVQARGSVRVLLVICRPAGREDVPFRSVANRLVKGLTDDVDPAVTLHVLRPPTFEALG